MRFIGTGGSQGLDVRVKDLAVCHYRLCKQMQVCRYSEHNATSWETPEVWVAMTDVPDGTSQVRLSEKKTIPCEKAERVTVRSLRIRSWRFNVDNL